MSEFAYGFLIAEVYLQLERSMLMEKPHRSFPNYISIKDLIGRFSSHFEALKLLSYPDSYNIVATCSLFNFKCMYKYLNF